MERELVSESALNEWMTQQLRQVEDCEGCVLTMKYRLQQPDADGCNWSEANLRTGPKTNAQHASPIANAIIGRARLRFNVKD